MKPKKHTRLLLLPQRDLTPLTYVVSKKDTPRELVGTVQATSYKQALELVEATFPAEDYSVEFVPKH
jgi:hypothetical protein